MADDMRGFEHAETLARAIGPHARPSTYLRWRKGEIGSVLQCLWMGPGGKMWIDVPRVDLREDAVVPAPYTPGERNPPAAKSMKQQIEAMETEGGGFTRESLAKLGVTWPPPKGWKKKLIKDASDGR